MILSTSYTCIHSSCPSKLNLTPFRRILSTVRSILLELLSNIQHIMVKKNSLRKNSQMPHDIPVQSQKIIPMMNQRTSSSQIGNKFALPVQFIRFHETIVSVEMEYSFCYFIALRKSLLNRRKLKAYCLCVYLLLGR